MLYDWRLARMRTRTCVIPTVSFFLHLIPPEMFMLYFKHIPGCKNIYSCIEKFSKRFIDLNKFVRHFNIYVHILWKNDYILVRKQKPNQQ